MPTGPSISAKDLNRLREMSAKFGELEDKLNKVLRDLKGLNINEIRESISEIKKKLELKVD